MSNSDKPTALNSADPIRNFTLTTEERIRAMTIGPPPWAVRKRKIEDTEERLSNELVELYDELVQKGRDDMEVEISLKAAATAIDFKKVNDLITTHNRYYPIEANLPMDPKGSGYLVYGRAWMPEEPFTPVRIFALAMKKLERRREREQVG